MTKNERRAANRDDRAQRLSVRRKDKGQSTRNRVRSNRAWKRDHNTQETL